MKKVYLSPILLFFSMVFQLVLINVIDKIGYYIGETGCYILMVISVLFTFTAVIIFALGTSELRNKTKK